MKNYYWTCFGLKDKDPKDMHCTHKFLGDLSDSDLIDVKFIIDYFWEQRQPEKPKNVLFNIPVLFGVKHDIPVLVPLEFPALLGWVRAQLDFYRDDDFPSYRPHITVDEHTADEFIEAKFTHYYLCKGEGDIMRSWKFI